MQNNKYDENIIKALKQLKIPLKNFKGNDVYFDKDKRGETIYEHIANKNHHLYVKDIVEIPKILLDKKSSKNDKKNRQFCNYIGKRGKKKEKAKYLKIVTRVKQVNKEFIITVN
ncbi:MAG: hypothetical protein IJ186_05440 [Bacilli bacterium]|nr:hypothetical protein [Bacilli bacterium]